ncbi:MAG TPA: DinB family protein [Anaerolineales bacterium]|nr:DinB family protein [Anaerolineales bacterium]
MWAAGSAMLELIGLSSLNKTRTTVLLDLDDTLLRNDMGVFLPAYFKAIQSWLAEFISGGDFMPAFLQASQAMLQNDRPDRTLAETFWNHFLSSVDADLNRLQPAVDRFYQEAFPQLRGLTGPIPGARETVEALHRAGHVLVIATNPLFPAAAIHQRVDWAELTLANRDFDLITTFERFHAAKPDPAYYAEILAYLGWPDGPIVMVGNEAGNDIDSARDCGLATYHVIPGGDGDSQTDNGRHGAGDLRRLPAWLAARDEQDLAPDYSSPAAALAVLKSTASALHSLARETDPSAWQTGREGEWSPLETLVHLRDVEMVVNEKRAETFLTETFPFIAGVDTDTWYDDGFGDLPPVDVILDGFIRSRLSTLETLARIPAESWDRPARHSIFGPTDLTEIASIMAGHDRTHMKQILADIKNGTSGG